MSEKPISPLHRRMIEDMIGAMLRIVSAAFDRTSGDRATRQTSTPFRRQTIWRSRAQCLSIRRRSDFHDSATERPVLRSGVRKLHTRREHPHDRRER
jgi:hypothetical protein